MDGLELAADILDYLVRAQREDFPADRRDLRELVTTFAGDVLTDVARSTLEEAIDALLVAGLVSLDAGALAVTDAGRALSKRIARRRPAGQAQAIAGVLAGSAKRSGIWSCSDDLWAHILGERRANERARCTSRLSIVEARLAALDNWDEVSAIVADASDRRSAVAALTSSRFRWSEAQAQHALDLTLGRRTKLGRLDLAQEVDDLKSELASLD